ncbi:MAG: cytochrome c biogenesis protein CcdA [Chloroflexota bacterium]|nr:cytochrome c biogenesis protein CcdA [Chloroflexota bacterium]
MNQLIQAFSLGVTAILTNACLLPLYPGLLAFLAGSAQNERARRAAPLLGALVLAGVLTMMVAIGFVLFLLNQTFGALLIVVLPIVYLAVIGMGIALLLDHNPFARLSLGQAPLLKNPYAAAFVYGLLLAPMTLPCTGPIITSAFVLGARDSGALVDGLAYFLAFGLGFGFPLLLLPLVALPLQRRAVGWLTRQHTMLNRVSGLLLIAVGVFGILTELVPQFVPGFLVTPTAWALYWIAAAAVIIAVGVTSARQGVRQESHQP